MCQIWLQIYTIRIASNRGCFEAILRENFLHPLGINLIGKDVWMT